MGRGTDVDGLTLAAFVGVVVVGGANFVAVKETVAELDPLYGAAGRFALAGLVFLALLALTRTQLPRGAALLGAVIYGVLGFGIAYALMYFALVRLNVGVAAVLMASVPVFTLLLAVLQRLERLTVRGLAGGALAVAGIAVLSVNAFGGEVPLRYLLAAIVAPVVVAESTIVVKRFPRTDPIATNAVGMLTGAALLALASVAAGEAWTVPQAGATWLASVWLVLAGSVGLFWLFLVVVKRWTASASTFALPLMPVVAVALAVVLQGAGVGWPELAGGALVIAAVYFGVLHRERERPELAPADPGGCVGVESDEERAGAPASAPAPAN